MPTHKTAVHLNKKIIYVTGLPRSGSTFLCQLLGHHPKIHCSGHSSPLCQTLMGLRHNLSDNEFFLSQLDVDFEQSYQRLIYAFRGFINGWFAETEKSWVVDKNPAILNLKNQEELAAGRGSNGSSIKSRRCCQLSKTK